MSATIRITLPKGTSILAANLISPNRTANPRMANKTANIISPIPAMKLANPYLFTFSLAILFLFNF